MRTIGIKVPESLYRQFQALAEQTDRTISGLIRESMEGYLRSLPTRTSVLDSASVSVGKVKRPWASQDDLLGEMLKHRRPIAPAERQENREQSNRLKAIEAIMARRRNAPAITLGELLSSRDEGRK